MNANTDNININVKFNSNGDVILSGLNKKVRTTTQAIADRFKKASSSTKDFMKNTLLFTGVFQGATAMLRKGVQALKDWFTSTTTFQTAWANVTTLVDKSKTVLKGVKEKILDMAGSLGSAADLTKGLWLTISSGVKPTKALYALKQAAIAAKGGAADLYKVVDIGTTVMNVYGMKVSELPAIYDRLFETNKRAKTSISEISRSMGEAIGTFATVGGSFDELNSFIVAMTLSGVKTSQSMSALKAVIANVARPSNEAAEAAKNLKIEFSASALKAKGFANFLQELTSKVQGNVDAQVALFGSVEAFNAIAILTSETGIKRFNEAMDGMKNSAGNTAAAFKKQMEAFSNVWQALKDKMQAVFIKTLLPLIESAAAWFSENQKAIVGFVSGTVSAIKTVIGTLLKLKGAVVTIGATWLAFFAVTKIIAWKGAVVAAVLSVATAFKAKLLPHLARMAESFKLAGTFGVGFFGKLKSATANVSPTITGLTGKTGLLATGLKKVGLIGTAAFVGWKLGELINKIGFVRKGAQALFDFLLTASQKFYDRMSMLRNMTADQMKTTGEIEKVKALAREYGIYDTNLKRVYIALGQNREAYAQLSPAMQGVVDRFTALDQRQKDQQERQRQLTEYQKKYKAEIYETQRILLATMGINIPAWFEKTADAATNAGGAVNDAKKKFEDFAATLGIITSTGLQELAQDTTNLTRATSLYSDQLENNRDLQQSVWEKSTELVEKYVQAGKPVPGQLAKIHNNLKRLQDEAQRKNGMAESFEKMLKAMKPVNKILDTSIRKWIAQTDQLKKYTKEAKETTKEVTNLYDMLNKQISTFQGTADLMDGIERAGRNFLDLLDEFGVIGEGTRRVISGVIDGIGQLKSGFEQVAQGQSQGGIVGMLTQMGGYAQIAAVGVQVLGTAFEALTRIDWGKRAADELQHLSGVTGEMTERLATMAEELNSVDDAFRRLLPDLIQAANILNEESFTSWADEVKNLFAEMESGYLLPNIRYAVSQGMDMSDIIAQYAETFQKIDDSIGAIINRAKELGYEGTSVMNDILSKAREYRDLGIEFSSAFAYIDEQYANYASNLQDYIGQVTNQASMNRAIKHTTNLIAAMQADGKSIMDIIDTIGPSLDDIMAKAKESGYETKGLSEMLGLRKFITDNKDALTMMDSSIGMMQALGNAGMLTQQRFGNFQNDLHKTFLKLDDNGKNSKKALEAILPSLQQQVWYAKQNNLELSEETKKLVERAKNKGYDIDKMKTQSQMQEEMADNTQSMADSLKQLVELLGKGTGAMGAFADNTARAAGAAAGFSGLTGDDLMGGTRRDMPTLPGAAAGAMGGGNYAGMTDFLNKYRDKNTGALRAVGDATNNLAASTQNTVDTQKIMQLEIFNTAAGTKSGIDGLSGSMNAFTASTKNNAGQVTESMDAVITKVKDTAASYSKITEEIISSTNAARSLANIPAPSLPAIPGTDPLRNNNNNTIFAAKGLSLDLNRPTRFTMDDGTEIIAGEAGKERLTIAPVKTQLNTKNSTLNTPSNTSGGGGKGELIVKLDFNNKLDVNGTSGGQDKDKLKEQIAEMLFDNFQGVGEEIAARVIEKMGG